jgi:spoIIIJ-associated protein
MRTVEAEGSTVEEAVANALARLGVGPDEAAVEVLEDSSRGFLGLGVRKARVRATVSGSLASQEPAPASEQTQRDRPSFDECVSRETAAVDAMAARAAQAREVLARVLRDVTDGASIEIQTPEDDPSTIKLVITHGDSGMLIGRHGQTLDAMEHLLNRIVFREDGPAAGRVALDVENYREKRQEQLAQQARRLAEKARITGQSIAMSPMSARDRRSIHLALRDEPGVTTASEGERDDRHVVIQPERSGARHRPPARR